MFVGFVDVCRFCWVFVGFCWFSFDFVSFCRFCWVFVRPLCGTGVSFLTHSLEDVLLRWSLIDGSE